MAETIDDDDIFPADTVHAVSHPMPPKTILYVTYKSAFRTTHL